MYAIVNVPVLDIRMERGRRAEMGSQVLFSEEVYILSKDGNLHEVQTVLDGYRGFVYCEDGDLIPKKVSPYTNFDQVRGALYVNRLRVHLYHEPDTIYGPVLTLAYGSRLMIFDVVQQSSRWVQVILPDSSTAYIQSGDASLEYGPILNRHEICKMSLNFLGIPYTWGGRSSFGYDCSGFVQMLYRQMGLSLPRDSKDQFLSEKLKSIEIKDLQPGDLIFYGDIDHRIKHVGMSLGGNQFIHTSAVTENMPYVRISSTEGPAWNGTGYYPTMFAKTLKGKDKEAVKK